MNDEVFATPFTTVQGLAAPTRRGRPTDSYATKLWAVARWFDTTRSEKV